MKTVAYLRVSTGSQDVANQKLAILDYARQKHFAVDRFVEVQVSAGKSPAQRRVEELLGTLQAGDRLVVSELSRLGRSLGQVIQLVEELVRRKICFVAIKEGIRFEGQKDLQTKVMIALFGLFAEVERDLISERTKEGLAAARAKGRLLGRPKGALGKSKLDGKEEEVRLLLAKKVSKASIAKIVEVSRTALVHFIQTRSLVPKASKSGDRKPHP
jgi:DNA invertase Pin-like site-specific DNA recombinase